MDYSIISPVIFDKLTDKNNPKSEGLQYTVTITPVGVEQSFPLFQEEVVRAFIAEKNTMLFTAKKIDPKAGEQYVKQSDELVGKFPVLKYYGMGRSILMAAIQDRQYSVSERFLIMNYSIKTLQTLIDTGKEDEAPQFTGYFMSHPDRSEILALFKDLQQNVPFSVIDALSMINSLPGTERFGDVKKTVLKRLGYKEDGSDIGERSFKECADDYLALKKKFREDFLREGKDDSREYYLENVMVGFIWSMNMPFSDFSLSIWDNFAFFNVLFNTLKVLLTLYISDENPDEDFVKAVAAFDESLRAVNNGLVKLTVEGLNKRGFNTNGDMAVLAIS